MSYRVAVLGIGGVGGLLSALLWKSKADVTCIATERSKPHLEGGIRIESGMFGGFTAHPEIDTRLREEADILIVAVKAPALEDSIGRIDASLMKECLVLPLMNGLEHISILRKRFGGNVLAGNISVEAFKAAPDLIKHTSPFIHLEMSADDPALRMRMPEHRALFQGAGIDAVIMDNEAQVIWGKLVRLNALACTTAASGKPIGQIRTDPDWRPILERCVAEGCAVSRLHGFEIDPSKVMAQIDALPSGLESSMKRDIFAGRPSELDAIPGAVVRAGMRKGVRCPTIMGLMMQAERNIPLPGSRKKEFV